MFKSFNLKNESNAILTIAFRDVTKLLRDRVRIISSLVFPIIFIGVLGKTLEAGIGDSAGFDILTFVFTGVFAQTLFQSTASGVIFLLQDRENDFSKEMFVAPVSPYSVILGKIFGESMVAFIQGVGVMFFGFIMGVHLSLDIILRMIPAGMLACLLGGAFGILILSIMSEERTVRQIFPFLIFPQLFLAGVFAPIKEFPLVLGLISKITPMTYAVDFMRGIYYAPSEAMRIAAHSPLFNLMMIVILFTSFLCIGTYLFVRKEKNR